MTCRRERYRSAPTGWAEVWPGCGWGKQLAGENICQPMLVPLRCPAPVCDEQPVDLGGHERVDDVGGAALCEPRPQRAGAGQGPGDLTLALLSLPGVSGQQRCCLGIGA